MLEIMRINVQLLDIYGGEDMSNSWTSREQEKYIQLLDKEGERKRP